MFLRSKITRAFRVFSDKTIADAVKSTVIQLAAVALAPPLLATLLGIVSKGLIDTLLQQASRVERKLDLLLREPLVSGLKFLRQALIHDQSSVEEKKAYENLLDQAHASLTRALSLAVDSREDSVFIRAIDCVALAAHPGHRTLALMELEDMNKDLGLISGRVDLLLADAAEETSRSEGLRRFLAHDDWGGKPVGYAEQLWIARRRIKQAERIRKRADEAQSRLRILQGIVEIATRLANAG